MSVRELVVLGTASQVPTRHRAHNGYLLRWDGEAILFDPGEGTQRQLTFAGVSPTEITHICITHAHGDHCLGLPGVLQRLSLDEVRHTVHVHYPSTAQRYIDALVDASAYDARADVELHPAEPGCAFEGERWRLEARALDHRIDTLGYRLQEPDGVTLIPDRLEAAGVLGADRAELVRTGSVAVGGGRVELDEVSVPRRGQSFAFVMDTAPCLGAVELARGADLLVAESTFLEEDVELARSYKHLTARQAGAIAAEAEARRLVLTHFSQRYPLDAPFAAEAAESYGGPVTAARDLDRVPIVREARPADG